MVDQSTTDLKFWGSKPPFFGSGRQWRERKIAESLEKLKILSLSSLAIQRGRDSVGVAALPQAMKIDGYTPTPTPI